MLVSAERSSDWMLLCICLAGDMCHLALFQIQVKGTSWTVLPFSPTTSAHSTAPLLGFYSNRYHSCTAVAGTLLVCSSEAMQDSADAALPVQFLPSAVGGEQVLSTSSEGSSWTRPTCPSANTICKMLLLGEIPAPLPLSSPPYQLQLLYHFSLQSTLLQLRKKLPPFTLPSTPPSPFQQRCHPPSHHSDLLTLSHKLKRNKISGTAETVLR